MKKYISCALLCVMLHISASAQFDYTNTYQQFYDKPVNVPRIGFDYLRERFQQIIAQQPNSNAPDGWRNFNEYLTSVGSPAQAYEEIGTYHYDTVHQVWLPAGTDKYDLGISLVTGHVIEAKWVHYNADSMTNYRRWTQIFYLNNRVDSISEQKANSVQFSTYYLLDTKKFTYRPDGRLNAIYTFYAHDEVFTDTLIYDTMGRVLQDLLLDKKPGSNTRDSSSRTLYTYDNNNKVISLTDQLYIGTAWKTMRYSEYTYNAYGSVATAKSAYFSDQGQSLRPSFEFSYTPDAEGKLNEFIQVSYLNNGDTLHTKTLFHKSVTGEIEYALEYVKKGPDYDTVPITRYLFSYPTVPVAVKEVESRTGNLAVFPNPVKDQLHIDANNVAGQITIYDISGMHMITKDASGENQVIDISALPSGMYWLKAAGVKPVKFMKE